MRLVEGARDLKSQLVEALKVNTRLQSKRLMRFESGTDEAHLIERRDSSPIDDENDNLSLDSPMINVRMRVSSSTQTEY